MDLTRYDHRIKKCSLSEEEICFGCFRTFNDIRLWNKGSSEDKKKMIGIAERSKTEHAIKLTFSKN